MNGRTLIWVRLPKIGTFNRLGILALLEKAWRLLHNDEGERFISTELLRQSVQILQILRVRFSKRSNSYRYSTVLESHEYHNLLKNIMMVFRISESNEYILKKPTLKLICHKDIILRSDCCIVHIYLTPYE